MSKLRLTIASRTVNDEFGCHSEPSRWDEVRRAQLRAELDAYYASLYGLTRDELRYISPPIVE